MLTTIPPSLVVIVRDSFEKSTPEVHLPREKPVRTKLLLQLSEEGEEVEGEEEEEEDGCGGGGGVFYRHTGNQTIEIQQHLVS
ncbi:hypothetical protein OUZ56_011240 [Daphnia magna]|uniref:Uncharacterized protein n=1 Tax=Daphnia magna TaxID=35525 RepID=A0ABQ9YZZ6_9CRUS|nr:hypothetical protein OUZ56_011044 [Daphnia magna]KAK4006077.1 hypothetical protein OUZ56_011214 [Daphnia magna]KAK4006078.1 hypothetical protein OUZ56_011221 [Daphnia magna]KAK4006082.1 hypothetical protein OUZ56_011234 [Daphnia magna]KAK4006083.1 hypothetical protein OUZ56_011236 [Daphnia magna]